MNSICTGSIFLIKDYNDKCTQLTGIASYCDVWKKKKKKKGDVWFHTRKSNKPVHILNLLKIISFYGYLWWMLIQQARSSKGFSYIHQCYFHTLLPTGQCPLVRHERRYIHWNCFKSILIIVSVNDVRYTSNKLFNEITQRFFLYNYTSKWGITDELVRSKRCYFST